MGWDFCLMKVYIENVNVNIEMMLLFYILLNSIVYVYVRCLLWWEVIINSVKCIVVVVCFCSNE